jgi:replicative DNA helicase
MSRQQVIYRFLSTSSNINTNRIKSGKMSIPEMKNLRNTMKIFSALPIFIDDNPNLTLVEIRSKIRTIFKDKNTEGLVIIDYLQLMKVNTKLENRVQEISYITRNLKILAKEFEIPILLLSQLSRSLESRVNKRPMLSDLRESGCLNLNNNIDFKFKQSWAKNSIKEKISNPFYLKGFKPSFHLNFGKKKISLTGNHKILSKQGWIKLSQTFPQTSLYFIIEKNLEKLSNYSFSLIKDISYAGLKKVFDNTIPFYHNYIFKNVVLHNSIEQDADIVIMLYRENYYTKLESETEETELIIAKHRNGPIGTAKIKFNSSITSFQN